MHYQNQGKQIRFSVSCWTIELQQFHWNALNTNISRADNSVKNLFFLRFYWEISEQSQWCRDQIHVMVFLNRESILVWYIPLSDWWGFDMHISDFSNFAWFLQTLTLKSPFIIIIYFEPWWTGHLSKRNKSKMGSV